MTEMLLLGAGASADAGVPTSFQTANRILGELKEERHRKVANFVVGGLLYQIGATVGNPLDLKVDVEALIAAATSVLDVQQMNGAFLQRLEIRPIPSAIEAITRQQGLLLSDTFENILAVRDRELSALAAIANYESGFTWLSHMIGDVSHSYRVMMRSHVDQLINTGGFRVDQVAAQLLLPRATLNRFTSGARSFVDAEIDDQGPAESSDPNSGLSFSELDQLLARLRPDFVEMRHGSWQALSHKGPDYLRHAGTSQRELVRQVLEFLVPAKQLPEDQRQGAAIKARLTILLADSKSDARFADDKCRAVVSYYDQLNKYTHHNQKHESSLRAILQTGECLLTFILVNGKWGGDQI